MDRSPRVAVVMPVFNCEPWVQAAVESILGQTYEDFTLHAIDDGSTDGTRDILASIRDPRLVVHRNNGNLGVVASLRRGAALAAGDCELIARQDGDDISLPTRLERQVQHLDSHPTTAVVGSLGYSIDAHGASIGTAYAEWTGIVGTAWALHWSPSLIHTSVLMRRAVFERAGGYRPMYYPAEDWDLWLRMWQFGDVENLGEYLVCYRQRSDSISGTARVDHLGRVRAALLDDLGLDGAAWLATPVPIGTLPAPPLAALEAVFERLHARYQLDRAIENEIAVDAVRILGRRRTLTELCPYVLSHPSSKFGRAAMRCLPSAPRRRARTA